MVTGKSRPLVESPGDDTEPIIIAGRQDADLRVR